MNLEGMETEIKQFVNKFELIRLRLLRQLENPATANHKVVVGLINQGLSTFNGLYHNVKEIAQYSDNPKDWL